MRPIRLAYRYAKALFELAGEQHIQDEIFRDMKLFAVTCSQNRELRLMLQSPVIKFDKKNNVIKELFGKHFHATTLAYTALIVRKGREMILPEIAEQYALLYREWKGIKTAKLSTAVPVDEALHQKIIQMLQEQMKVIIELESEVKPGLIGGFVLSVEDRQLDASILKKIKRLTREFQVNVYEKKI